MRKQSSQSPSSATPIAQFLSLFQSKMEVMQQASSDLVPLNVNPQPSDPSRYSKIMEKLKAAVLQRLSNATPNKPVPPSLIAVIESRLAVSFLDFKTPIHLTYASMIQQAIKDLNEENGLSEKAISDYILENFEGLPWAHNRYLRHYLTVLCENEEIVCNSKGCYTTPDLLHRPKLRRRLLRRKPGRKRKECEIDGNLGVEENEVCLEDEENLTFRNLGIKRSRRRSLVLMDDNDDDGATEVVGKEGNNVESDEMHLIEERNELVNLKDGDEIDGKDSKQECNAGNVDRVGEPSEVNTETQPPLVPSVVEKMLPVECECQGEPRTETLQFVHEDSSANLMLVPIESVKESNATLIKGESTKVSGFNVDGDNSNFNDKFEKVVCGRSFCAVDMAIVPFKADSSEFAEKKEIVCCLPFDLPKEPKKMHRPKRRPKHSQEGLPSSYESMLASSVSPVGPKLIELGELCEVPQQLNKKTEVTYALLEPSNFKDLPFPSQQAYMSCPRLPTIVISFEKGSIETKFEKQKLHSESSPSCHRLEIMSPVDDDFDVPLQQVLSNHSKKRRLSSENSTPKSPSASSLMAGQRLQAVFPDPENSSESIRPRGEEVTCIKRNQKQGQRLQHPKRQLRPQIEKRSDLVEDGVVAPEREVLLSSDQKEGSYDGKEDENPHDITSQQIAMEHQHQQQGECQDQGSSLHIEPMAETVYLDNQHHDLGEIQPKMVRLGLHKACEVDLRDSSPGQKKNGQHQSQKQQHQSEMAEVVCFDSEPVTNVGTDTQLVLDNEQFQSIEKQTDKPQLTTKVGLTETLSTQNEKGNQKDQEQHHQGKTAEVGCSDSELVVPIATMEEKMLSESVPQKPEQLECELGIQDSGSTLPKQSEKKRRGRPPKNSSSSLHVLQHQKNKMSKSVPQKHCRRQKKCGKKDGHKLQRKQEGATKEDVAIAENLRDQPQSEPCETTPCKLMKKRALGTTRKSKEAAAEDLAPLNMHDQQQQEQHEPAGHQLMKKDDQKTPRKRKRAAKAVGDPLNVLDQQQEGAAEIATYQLEKKDGRGRRMKKKKTTAGDVAAQLNWFDEQKKGLAVPSLHAEQQDGPSPQVLYQLRRKDVLGSLRKEAVPTTKNDGALDSMRDGPEGGPSPPNSHDQQEKGPTSSKLHGGSEKGSTPQIVHSQPEKGPTDPETKQIKKKRGRGRPKKKEATTIRGISISHDQQQGQALQKLHDQLEGPTPPGSHGPTPKNLHDQLEEVPTPRNTPDQLEEGKHEPVTNQQKKKSGRGSSRKIKATIDDVTGVPTSDNQQEEGITPPSVLDQPKQRAGGGVTWKKNAPTKDSEDVQDSHNQQAMNHPNVPDQLEVGPNEQATNQQKRKVCRGMPKKIEATTEDVLGLPKLPDQQEERLTPPNLPDQHEGRATSPVLHDKLEEGLPAPETNRMELEKGQGILRNKKEATTEDEARLPTLPEHHQEELACMNILSHDLTPQQLAQEEHSQDQLPKSELVATPLSNQPPKEQEEQCKEMVTKQKSVKMKLIEVPLSFKDQLRSRMKHPYQAGT